MPRQRQHLRRTNGVAINARTDDAVKKGRTRPRAAWTTVVLLTAIMGVALALHLWGIRRDLPFDNDLDEANFVLPAVRIAAGWLRKRRK